MRPLILIFSMTLASCGEQAVKYVQVYPKVPTQYTEPVAKPERPLLTYKDAVVRDAERGAVIDRLLEDRAAVAKILDPKRGGAR